MSFYFQHKHTYTHQTRNTFLIKLLYLSALCVGQKKNRKRVQMFSIILLILLLFSPRHNVGSFFLLKANYKMMSSPWSTFYFFFDLINQLLFNYDKKVWFKGFKKVSGINYGPVDKADQLSHYIFVLCLISNRWVVESWSQENVSEYFF